MLYIIFGGGGRDLLNTITKTTAFWLSQTFQEIACKLGTWQL